MKWITREKVKVDRVACPWLIKKFVDPEAEFLFVPADRVLATAAQLLKETFRSSDILARLGGDEFVALAAVEEDEGAESLTDRLQEQFDAHNALSSRPYSLSVSVGVANFEDDRYTIEELMAQADRAMYEEKRGKPSTRYTHRAQYSRPRIEAVA